MLIEIVSHIDLAKIQQYMATDMDCGAVNIFIGKVRNQSQGKSVLKLEFEAYQAMAILELEKIALTTKDKFNITKIALQHVIGTKKPGEMVVALGVASPHRKEAFHACEYIMDQLKSKVPIWKKEFFLDSSVWVSSHP